MSQQALKILAATDPPKRLLIDDDTLKEAAGICPALLARVRIPGAGRDKFTIGIMASFNRILIAFEQNGLIDVLREITDDMMAETDALLSDSPKELSYVFDKLPLIVKMMEASHKSGTKSDAQGGIVLTYVTIARHLIDSSVSEDMKDASDVEMEEEDGPPVGSSPILAPADSFNKDLNSTTAENSNPQPTYSPDVKDVVKKILDSGVHMDSIQIIPYHDERGDGKDIAFKITGPLPDVNFETIARINAMFMKATGRGIALESEGPVHFIFRV